MSIDMLRKNDRKKIIGARQTAKAVEKGIVELVYLAEDADIKVTNPIEELCMRKGIPVVKIPTMYGLGKICGIAVGAAAVAIRK